MPSITETISELDALGANADLERKFPLYPLEMGLEEQVACGFYVKEYQFIAKLFNSYPALRRAALDREKELQIERDYIASLKESHEKIEEEYKRYIDQIKAQNIEEKNV